MLLAEGVPPLTIAFYRTLFGSLLLGIMLAVAGGRLRLGLVARVGSTVYDGSVTTQLALMRRRLVENA